MPPAVAARVACIDIGSNGIRCIAAEAKAGQLQAVLQQRASVRLGESVFLSGAIAPEAMDAAVAALKGFREQVERFQPVQLRVVATSAVRDARNRKTLLRRAQAEAGVRIEVISGAEEARLVHVAVAKRMGLEQPSKPWLLMDVGGGSLEVSLAGPEGLEWTKSRPMGAVRLLENFASIDKPKAARKLIEEAVAALRLPIPKGGDVAGLAATGGNIDELARLIGAKDERGIEVVDVKRLGDFLAELQELEPDERARKHDLKKDRADVIVPAGLVYLQVARLAGVERIHVPGVALKDGVIAELAAEAEGSPQADEGPVARRAYRSALSLGRRFGFEESHGVQVQRLALSLFDHLHASHGLDGRDRLILSASALLHDVGRHIADAKHHKHSYYLISQSEILGLTRHEVELVAVVARYHRKAEPKAKHTAFSALTAADQRRVERMAALLRVADALDRPHSDNVRSVHAELAEGRLRLRLEARKDVELERWAVGHKGGLLERVMECRIEVEREASHG